MAMRQSSVITIGHKNDTQAKETASMSIKWPSTFFFSTVKRHGSPQVRSMLTRTTKSVT